MKQDNMQCAILRLFCLPLLLSLVFVFHATDSSSTVAADERSEWRMTDEDRLFRHLFHERWYNKDSRPVLDVKETLNVELGISLLRIIEVEEKNQIFRANLWLRMIWKDPKLVWNSSEYGELEMIDVPNALIWKPDIVLFDSAENNENMGDAKVTVKSDGTCLWYPKAIFSSYCPIDISWFPFDEQNCILRFESWTYDVSKLNLSLLQNPGPPLALDYYRNNSEWDLVGTSVKRDFVHYLCCQQPTSILEFNFRIRRRILFYCFNLVMPCTLISILAIVAHVLPPTSSERIGFGITTLLALTVNQLLVADQVPPSSEAVPLIGIYFGCTMILNSFSIGSMICVSHMYLQLPGTVVRHHWVRMFICNRLGRLLNVPNPNDSVKEIVGDEWRRTPDGDTSSSLFTKNDLTTQRRRDESADESQRENGLRRDGSRRLLEEKTSSSGAAAAAAAGGNDRSTKDDGDWRHAALVIDRLCFCLGVICLFIITVVFYSCAFFVRKP